MFNKERKMSMNDIYNLADGWLELESDPGLFTLLLEDMGVPDVQVKILSKHLNIFELINNLIIFIFCQS